VCRLEGGNLINGNLVVPKDPKIYTPVELSEALDEVVSEGVVVVDEKNHG
jgi:hypothetical protein